MQLEDISESMYEKKISEIDAEQLYIVVSLYGFPQ